MNRNSSGIDSPRVNAVQLETSHSQRLEFARVAGFRRDTFDKWRVYDRDGQAVTDRPAGALHGELREDTLRKVVRKADVGGNDVRVDDSDIRNGRSGAG